MAESAYVCSSLRTYAPATEQMHAWHCWDKLVLGVNFG